MDLADPPVVPGYAVLAPIARGGTSSVWRGRRLADGQPVALKVVAPADGDVATGLAEAGLLARIRHRHVVHLYDVLPLPDQASGRPAAVVLATQLAAGGSLGQVLASRRLLHPGELVTVLAPVAGALADLHQQGVVHGDLSLGNVLFLADGMPLLADLGTARLVGGGVDERYGTEAWSGMVAPEVLEGFAPGPESDVYQLGALAWRALTGEPPGLEHEREPLAEVAPELSAALVELVERCLLPEPERRPDAEELAVALLSVADPLPVELAPHAPPEHDLTQRIRQEASVTPTEKPRPGVLHRWARRAGATGRPGSAGSVPREAATAVGRRAPGAHRRSSGRRRAVVIGAVLGGVLVAGVSLLGAARWADTPQRPGRAPTVVASASTSPAPAGVPATAHSAATSASASRDLGTSTASGIDAHLVQGLLDGRARAWRSSDPQQLAAVMAPGSPAYRADGARIRRAAAEGLGYPGLSFQVLEVEPVSEGADSTVVQVRVRRPPLEARRGDGWAVRTPARTEVVELGLHRVEGEWRIWRWAPAR